MILVDVMRGRRRFPKAFLSVFLLASATLVFAIGAFMRIKLSLGFDSRVFTYTGPDDDDSSKHVLYPDRPWFMRGGLLRPRIPQANTVQRPKLWPHEDGSDRIVEQLMYVPAGYDVLRNSSDFPLKKILLYFGKNGWSNLPLGRKVFLNDHCPVDTCSITFDVSEAERADLILFKDRFVHPIHKRSFKQVWMLFLLECPQHTQSFNQLAGIFNWTATYRHDSDIVAPYEKFVLYSDMELILNRNVAAGKTKRVAWFVSNCAARNKRLQYAKELAKHITLDMFGKCGRRKCPRTSASHCFYLLDRDYKFYLAFENSNCRDYITEKFFVNGLGHNVIPIAMGARPEDYQRIAPPHSYIHVEDFDTPEALANYLYQVDRNDTLFNSYFEWKNSGEFINTHFWCRVCAMLHAPSVPKVYTDLQAWWAGKGTCTKGRWKQTNG